MRYTQRVGRAVFRRLLWLGRLWLPSGGHVLVTGWPDAEGNVVETVRALLASPQTRVVWLVEDPVAAAAGLALPDGGAQDGGAQDGNAQDGNAQDANAQGRLRLLRKRTWRGVLAFMRARVTFFTHGLYSDPPPVRRKPTVNLWHGDGPKRALVPRGEWPPRADFLVSGSGLFAADKLKTFRIPPSGLVLTGNARCDQLRRPATPAELRSLGLDPVLPILMIMPTYRQARPVASRAHRDDVPDVAASADASRRLVEDLVSAARGRFQVVLKPHPLDADSWSTTGASLVTSERLAGLGIPLYRLLGASSALVSDYSSVWVDYLAVDRPMAFLVSDLDAFSSGRGFFPADVRDLLPGPMLESESDCTAFLDDVVAGGSVGAEARRATRAAIDYHQPTHSARALVEALRDRGVPV